MPAHIGLLLNFRDAARSISCIDSLLTENIDQVVVIDNSADQRVSASVLIEHYASDSRVFVDISERNLGFASGVDRGLKLCRSLAPGCRVLLINNDAVLRSGALGKLSVALDKSPLSLLAFANMEQHGEIIGPVFYHRMTGILTRHAMSGSFKYASGCCLLVNTARSEDDLFDKDFFMYGEDCELGWRLSARPQSMVHVDETLVCHEGSASSGLGSAFYEERMVAGHWILARKLSSNACDRWLLYAGRVVALSARAFVRSVRFKSLVPFSAFWRGWKLAFIYDPSLEGSPNSRMRR